MALIQPFSAYTIPELREQLERNASQRETIEAAIVLIYKLSLMEYPLAEYESHQAAAAGGVQAGQKFIASEANLMGAIPGTVLYRVTLTEIGT